MTGVILSAAAVASQLDPTAVILAVIATIGGAGGVLTTILQYRAGSRDARRATEDKLWQRLVTERERAEEDRDEAEDERDRALRELQAERLYVHVLVTAMMAAGLTVPKRPKTT